MAKKDNEVWNLVCGSTMFLEIVQYLFASFHSISFLFIFTILLTWELIEHVWEITWYFCHSMEYHGSFGIYEACMHIDLLLPFIKVYKATHIQNCLFSYSDSKLIWKNGETRNDSIGIFITKSSKFATFWNGNALNVQHDLTNSWVDTKLFVYLGIVLFCFSDGTVLSY